MSPPLFQLRDVSKLYLHEGRELIALDRVSLDVQAGEIFGIIGMSGAGKSTLIRCLANLASPSCGAVLFEGSDIALLKGENRRQFHQSIGMIFQQFNLLASRTVEGNIAYPLEIAHMEADKRRERVKELLELVGLTDKKDSYPSQLSGGQKQRVGIARALANHPKVLLCDEATSALDPKTTREILHLLKDLNQRLGLTIVLITHEMDVIQQICHKVAVMEEGKVIEIGPVLEIFSHPSHPTTAHFLQRTQHEIPREFFARVSPTCKLLRLRFRGSSAGEPVISDLIRKFDVHANILLGWLDRFQSSILGTLVIELTGSPENLQRSVEYLFQQGVHCEEVEHDN